MKERQKEYYANNGTGVKIVIVDSGVRLSHPKLSHYIVDGYNPIDNSSDFDDHLGHGTAVTGIIKQHAPEAEVFVIKLFDDDFTVQFEDLCKALEYIDEKVEFDILNLSIGVTECPDHERLRELCDNLSQRGVVIAAFDNLGAISYPAAYSTVIGVDSHPSYSNPYDYDYIESDIINIRAKGNSQRVIWSNPDYFIQSGSSFACAHITGLVAKMMQGKKLYTKEVMNCLRRYATEVFYTRQYRDNRPKFQITKAICFPYNKEIDTLCRNMDLLSFKLMGVYDSKYSFNIGKTIYPNKEIKSIERLDWTDDFDTVILGHVGDLISATRMNYREYIIKCCKEHKKNLFQFDVAMQDERIYTPNIQADYIPPLNYGKLYLVGKPVVAVFGTSSRQGKFSLQLAMRKEFTSLGYTVGQLGTEPQSLLFGFDEAFPCGYGTELSLDEQTTISYINYLLHKIEAKNPDIIIVGAQSGTIPYAMYNLRNNSPYQHELLLASNPDAVVLCINFFDELEYIKRTITYIEALSESKVVALSMFPFDRAFSWNAASSVMKPVSEEMLETKKLLIEREINIDVFLQDDTAQLCTKIIDCLS